MLLRLTHTSPYNQGIEIADLLLAPTLSDACFWGNFYEGFGRLLRLLSTGFFSTDRLVCWILMPLGLALLQPGYLGSHYTELVSVAFSRSVNQSGHKSRRSTTLA